MTAPTNRLQTWGLAPADFGVRGAVEFRYRGEKQPRCPDCGRPVRLSLTAREDGTNFRIRVVHPGPSCPEFARRIEGSPDD